MQVEKEKSALRKAFLERRRLISERDRLSAGNAAFELIINTDEFKNAPDVFCYAAKEFEFPADKITDCCLKAKKPVALPLCEGKKLRFFYINGYDDLERGAFSLLEPKRSCREAFPKESTFCVTPALCCSESGKRIGYGGGYYDRFFAENRCFKACLCYEDFIADFEASEYDVKVDMIVTESCLRRI